MFGSLLCGLFVKTGHEFLIVEHVLLHFCVFASDWAIYDGRANSFLHLPRGSYTKGAVDDREGGLVLLDVGNRRSDEIRKLERVANMQNRTGASDLDWRNIHARAFVRATQDP
jgi:hypothetical protein